MPYGLTPFDKQSYKESKRRRHQALIAEKTGRILPFTTAKRRIIIICCISVAVIGFAVGVYFAYNAISENSFSKTEYQLEQEHSDELLQVVNNGNMLASDYVPKLENFGKFKVNTLAKQSLEKFCEEAEQTGIKLTITSAYVSFEQQEKLYNENLSHFLTNPDYTEVRAKAAAQKRVPKAGCCEAQTGLLIGFDVSNEKAAAFADRKCIDYGFVQRYSKDKEDITKISENKSFYRFVGIENARKMRSFNMCLEEYSDYLNQQKMKNN